MTDLLRVNQLSKTFGRGATAVDALQNVSFGVKEGECLAVVGESGSGKTTLANLILGIIAPSAGDISLNGQSLPVKRTLEHRRIIQLVQQNPLSSLNPKRSIGASVRLGLDVYGIGNSSERWALTEKALEDVGLPADYRKRAPGELSGGQRQRAAIARALACQSDIIVLDEPTSALDVLVQARVLRLLDELRLRKKLTYIFITHDLSVVRNVANRVAVFRDGTLLELAATETLFEKPQHDYTKQLITSVPVISHSESDYINKLKSTLSVE